MKNKLQILITLIFLALVGWWFSFQSVVTQQGTQVQWFNSIYGVMALIGAVIGFIAAQKWGGFKTVLGKSLMFFSLGLLAQEAGQLIYAYYNYVSKIQIPYPSYGDIAYFGSVLLYIIAAIYLTQVSGAKFALKQKRYQLTAVLVPVVILGISYTVFLRHHQYDTSHPLTVFLDFGYPMGQAIYISLAVTAYLLSRKQLGGVVKNGILFIIVALVIQYIADFTFIFQSSRGTWLAGKSNDLMYLTAYFAMATAMVKFISIYSHLKDKTKNLKAENDNSSTAKTVEAEAKA